MFVRPPALSAACLLSAAVALLAAVPAVGQQTYSISDAQGAEGTFVVIPIETAVTPPETVSFTISYGFTGSASVTDVGESRQTFGWRTGFELVIPLAADLLNAETDETFDVTISTDAPGWTAASSTATVTIQNFVGIHAPQGIYVEPGSVDFMVWPLVPGATEYVVSCREQGAANWVEMTLSAPPETDLLKESNVATDLSLPQGTYDCRVKALLGNVESVWSQVATVVVVGTPGVPANVHVGPARLVGSIEVSWDSLDPSGTVLYNYDVAWGEADDAPDSFVIARSFLTAWEDPVTNRAGVIIGGLRGGVLYGARVRASRAVPPNQVGDWSDVAVGRAKLPDKEPPPPPGGDGDGDGDGDDDDGDGEGDGDRNDPANDRRPKFDRSGVGVGSQRWVLGGSVVLQLPEAVGGDGRLTYRLDPALPPGVRFDKQSRTVSGSPVEVMAATRYVYKVTDSDARGADSDYMSFQITVVESADAPLIEIEHDLDCEFGVWWCRAVVGVPAVFTDADAGAADLRTWDLGDGKQSSERIVEHAWLSPGFYKVTLTRRDGATVSAGSVLVLVVASDPAGTCEADAETFCLQDSRYAVDIEWWSDADGSGGTVAGVGTNDSGLFFFFGPNNWEVLVKVLNGCSTNDHVWVYAAAATTLGYSLRVTDTVTGTVRRYRNEHGHLARATADSMAFPCDSTAHSRFSSAAGTSAEGPALFGPSASVRSSSEGECVESATTLCLLRNRYEVAVRWSTLDEDGVGRSTALPRTGDSGLFYFFEPGNWELLVKVLDACESNGHIWVFVASATDVGLELTVRDTVTGRAKLYFKDPGVPAAAIADVNAFAAGCRQPS